MLHSSRQETLSLDLHEYLILTEVGAFPEHDEGFPIFGDQLYRSRIDDVYFFSRVTLLVQEFLLWDYYLGHLGEHSHAQGIEDCPRCEI